MSFKNKLRERISSGLNYYSKPSFLIIGAQKAGTTSLFDFLSLHPDIVPSRSKELHYFDQDEVFERKDYSWYHSFFPFPHELIGDKITFEATPSYLYHPLCAERIYNYNSSIRLIIALRNPVDRAYSAWNMYKKFSDLDYAHAETRTLEEIVEMDLDQIGSIDFYNDPKGIIKRGIYYNQIKEYLKYFNPDQLFIYEDLELKKDTVGLLNKISQFLEIKGYEYKKDQLKMRHIGTYTSAIPDNIRITLSNFYEEHNNKLYDLIGRRFNW